MPAASRPLVLFGAFDRHNLGDLLFARVALASRTARDRPVLLCGLADRDLRPWGGPRVHALHRLAAEGALAGADLVHVGGEILTCTADQAATMLLPPHEVDATLAWLAREPAQAAAWRRSLLGTDAALPYVASRQELPMLRRVVFAPVGGVGIGALSPPDRATLLARLAAADRVLVRDGTTRALLRAAGVEAGLAPDPVEMLAVASEAAPPRSPPHRMAVQLAAEFDDDATLDRVADALAPAARRLSLEVVSFRAGAAPWHDDPRTPARLALRLRARGVAARPFDPVGVDELVALLAGADACACSSLHGLIVAARHGVPAVGLRKPGEAPPAAKLDAYVATWHGPDDGATVSGIDDLPEAMARVTASDPGRRRAAAQERARRAAEAWEDLARRLDADMDPDDADADTDT